MLNLRSGWFVPKHSTHATAHVAWNQTFPLKRGSKMKRQLGDMFPALSRLRITMAYQACLLT